MKKRRKKPKKEAACLQQTAQKDKQQRKSYHLTFGGSRKIIKEQIGVLLLYLQGPLPASEQRNYWRVFESVLRRHIELKSYEVNP